MQPISHKWKTRRSRYGVTILEVLFATTVVIVGMMGIASVFAVAGRRASESARAAESQALAQHWFGEALARAANDSTAWRFYDEGSGNTKQFSKTMTGVKGAPNPTPLLHVEVGTQSVCIDPAFYKTYDTRQNGMNTTGWIRPSVFPYYHDRFNPLCDPAYVSGAQPWPDQPRMLRVSVSAGGGLIETKSLEKIFSSQDELNLDLDTDGSIRPTRTPQFYYDFKLSQPSSSGAPNWQPNLPTNAIPVARTQSAQEYSWIATMSPAESVGGTTLNTSARSFYTMSLVVIHRRDVQWANPQATAPRSPGQSPRVEDGVHGERLVWVNSLSGDFQGGHGGRVQLAASDGVSPNVFVGDWIMLSKYIGFGSDSTNSPIGASVHRWYRVVGVDTDPTYGPVNDIPNNTTWDCWARNVVLDGPDWDFSPNSAQLTVGTLVKGAVNVIERIVEVR